MVAAWNLVDMDKLAQGKAEHHLAEVCREWQPKAKVSIERVDETHGNPMRVYAAMGSPRYPTRETGCGVERGVGFADAGKEQH